MKAEEEGVPLFPAEALQSTTLSRLARRVPGNPETREEAMDILKKRGAEAPERIRKELLAIAPETTPYAAGAGLKKATVATEKELEAYERKPRGKFIVQLMVKLRLLMDRNILILS